MHEDDDDRDIVEFSDEEGNTLSLEVLDYFFYNGDEYAVLGDPEDDCECGCGCEECEHECEDEEHEHSLYIMKVVASTNEAGEEMEEFIPVEEGLMEKLVEVVQTRFSEDADDEDEYTDEEDLSEEDGENKGE